MFQTKGLCKFKEFVATYSHAQVAKIISTTHTHQKRLNIIFHYSPAFCTQQTNHINYDFSKLII